MLIIVIIYRFFRIRMIFFNFLYVFFFNIWPIKVTLQILDDLKISYFLAFIFFKNVKKIKKKFLWIPKNE